MNSLSRVIIFVMILIVMWFTLVRTSEPWFAVISALELVKNHVVRTGPSVTALMFSYLTWRLKIHYCNQNPSSLNKQGNLRVTAKYGTLPANVA